MTAPVAVAGLGPDRLAEGARVLARSFDDDPLFAHLAPRAHRRPGALRLYMAATCRDALPFGQVHVALDGGRAVGVAAWLPPGAHPPSLVRQARLGAVVLRCALRSSPRVLTDGVRVLAAVERAHPREEHWYLALLGADVGEQGRGVGSALLAPVLARADAEGLPCYLETTKPRNLAWYGRHGFGVADELRPVPGGPPVWTMRREPRAA